MMLCKLELFKISYFRIISYFRKFNHRHKIRAFVFNIFVLRYLLGDAEKPFGIVLFRQFYVKRFVLFIFEKFGYFKPDKLVFAVNLRFSGSFLEFFQIIFFKSHMVYFKGFSENFNEFAKEIGLR